jgi:hypothetical protein
MHQMIHLQEVLQCRCAIKCVAVVQNKAPCQRRQRSTRHLQTHGLTSSSSNSSWTDLQWPPPLQRNASSSSTRLLRLKCGCLCQVFALLHSQLGNLLLLLLLLLRCAALLPA